MSRTLTVGFGFFLVFFAYFCFTSYHLPNAAGPDYKFSRVAADFYHDENRMAIFPDDEDKMVFSSYGNSRLLRPPMGFYLPGLMAKLPILKDLKRAYSYRVTVAMLAALTIFFIFIALKTYFNSIRYAIFGTLSIALMPQFSFYASYFSDDMISFLAAAMLGYAMVEIYKNGVSFWRQILFAFAAGVCVVSKQTAWIFLGSAIIFYFMYMLDYSKDYFTSKQFYLPLIFMALAFVIGGGWWLLFNMYHYGIGDVILSNVSQKMSEKHAVLDLTSLGFQARGLGIQHLIFLNSLNFLGATYIAFVGNLDWLRLHVGSLQYGFYMWILVGIVLNAMVLAYQTIAYFWERIRGISFESYPRANMFEILLYFAIILQFFLYTWHNVMMDVQVQGKYLMTIFIPMLILALSFVRKACLYLSQRFEYIEIPMGIKASVLVVLFALPIIVHLDALVDYVIPFYWPNLEIPVLLSWL